MKGVGNSIENWPYLENGERYMYGHQPWMTLKVTDNQYGRLS